MYPLEQNYFFKWDAANDLPNQEATLEPEAYIKQYATLDSYRKYTMIKAEMLNQHYFGMSSKSFPLTRPEHRGICSPMA